MRKEHRINFDDLKARADFRAVLLHYGLAPVGTGDQAKVPCPFHDDERPSCSVNLAKGLFHCFACQAKGNVLDSVHRMETKDGATVSLRQAGMKLAEICGIALNGSETRQETRRASTAKETAFFHRPPRLLATFGDQAASRNRRPSSSRLERLYIRNLPERRETSGTPLGGPSPKVAKSPSPGQNGAPGRLQRENEAIPTRNKPLGFRLTLDPSHPYLAERGLSPELVELFGLGFCSQGSMAGRVCIPIENANGELVAYAGRSLCEPDEFPASEEKYKLPVGFHKTLELWNLHRVRHCKHLIVVEGYFGAIRLHGLRLPAVALMGSSLSDEQVALLRDCPALRFVTVMLNGDEAGQKAVDIITVRLAKYWWTRNVVLPDGAQPDTVEKSVLEQLLGREQK